MNLKTGQSDGSILALKQNHSPQLSTKLSRVSNAFRLGVLEYEKKNSENLKSCKILKMSITSAISSSSAFDSRPSSVARCISLILNFQKFFNFKIVEYFLRINFINFLKSKSWKYHPRYCAAVFERGVAREVTGGFAWRSHCVVFAFFNWFI